MFDAARKVTVIAVLVVYLCTAHSKDIIRTRRATTIDNVQAIYNRFTRTSKGKATYYGKYPEGGLCSLDPPPPLANQVDWVKIAVGKDDFQGSLGCGMCVEIHGSGTPSTPDLSGTTPVTGVLKGMVYDLCGSCKQGDIDLYKPGNGVWDITLKAIDCPSLPGTVAYIQFKFTGSNEFYFKLQARNAKIPVAGVEVFNTVTNDWYCLKRTDDNYFTSEGLGKVTVPMRVRLTSITNENLETTITTLKNDESFPSDVQFSGLKQRGGSPDGIQCFGQGHKSSQDKGPAVDEKFCAGKPDGMYADPVDCSAFYECSKGKSFKQYCADGLAFNALIGKCDDAENVNCADQMTERVRNALNTRKRFAEIVERDNLGLRDISPRSTDSERRIVMVHKRKHHHHHHLHRGIHKYRYGGRAHKRHSAHSYRRKTHLKPTKTQIHQGSKRTSAEKRVNVKVKVHFTGPNLSGTYETKDPSNPKQGELTVVAVENAERGDNQDIPAKLKSIQNGKFKGSTNEKATHVSDPVLVDNVHSPMSFHDAGSGSPFHYGDDVPLDAGISGQKENKLKQTLVQDARMKDGTVQTTTIIQPNVSSASIAKTAERNASDGVHHAVSIKHFLLHSFLTKPQVMFPSKEKDGNTNQTSNKLVQISKERENTTENAAKAKLNSTIQAVMQNLLKGLKMNLQNTSASSNNTNTKNSESGEKINGTIPVQNVEKEQKVIEKDKTLSTSNGDLAPKITTINKVTDLQQDMNTSMSTSSNTDAQINVPKTDSMPVGVLLIVNKTRADASRQQTGNATSPVRIMPDVGVKVEQPVDNRNETNEVGNKNGGLENGNKTEPVRSHSKIESGIPQTKKMQNSAKEKDSSKDTPIKATEDLNSHNATNSIFGLMGIIGDLVRTKLQNTFDKTAGNSSISLKNVTTNGGQDSAENRNVTIGKVNISLQSVYQGGAKENAAQDKNGLNGTYVAEEPKTDSSNQLQVLESPKGLSKELSKPQVSDLKLVNGSTGGIKVDMINASRPANQSNKQSKDIPKPVENGGMGTMATNGTKGNKGSVTAHLVNVTIPVMRIRLKGPSNGLDTVAKILQASQDDALHTEGGHHGAFIHALQNEENGDGSEKQKPLHTTTVIIKQYNKNEKHSNYDADDTLPLAGSEEFDGYGNRKISSPEISMNEAQNLLNEDKSMLDNSAFHNAMFNPEQNLFPERKVDDMNEQQNGLHEEQMKEGGAEDFAQALKAQDDEAKHPHGTASKEGGKEFQQSVSLADVGRFGNIHDQRTKEIEKPHSMKPHVVSGYMNYGGSPMGNGNNGNYMDMQGMGGGMQGMGGMGGGMQGMGGGMQGMGGMGGGMQGMGGGMQGMGGMSGGMQGMGGMGGGMQSMQGMGGMGGGGAGAGGSMSPVGMQPIANQAVADQTMKQALSNMQDMAMKQIQSKYPGMPITMKAADNDGESEEESASPSQENDSGSGEEMSSGLHQETLLSEVLGKHKDNNKNSEKPEGSGGKIGQKFEDHNVAAKTQKLKDQETNANTKKLDGHHDDKHVEIMTDKSDNSKADQKTDQNMAKHNPEEHQNDNNKPTANQIVASKTNKAKQSDFIKVPSHKIDPKQICKDKTSGVYSNEEDPSKFVICYNHEAEERQCADGMAFNPREKVCEPSEQQGGKMDDKPKDKPKGKRKQRDTDGTNRGKVDVFVQGA